MSNPRTNFSLWFLLRSIMKFLQRKLDEPSVRTSQLRKSTKGCHPEAGGTRRFPRALYVPQICVCCVSSDTCVLKNQQVIDW